MPLRCCDCKCSGRVTKYCGLDFVDAELRRLRFECTEDREYLNEIEENYQLEKLKNATHEIKKLIDTVDDNLTLIKSQKVKRSLASECKVCDVEKNNREIVDYLDKNCKTCFNSYYCCDCPNKCSDIDETIDFIRHKHSYHKDINKYQLKNYACASDDKHCDGCWNDFKIKARRERSRSRSRNRSSSRRRSRSIGLCNDSDDDCYNNNSTDSYKPREPWRSGPYATNYPWKSWKINEMSN
jgi:hypothetical protein